MIIPTLNEQRRIEACLDSIGSDPRVEVVVSDGGSSDLTLEEVRRLRPTVLVVTGGPGRGSQLNRGAEASSADRLLFLHADCRLPDGWADAVVAALDDPDTVLAAFRLRTEPSDGRPAGRLQQLWLRMFDLRSHGLGIPYGDQAYAVRRGVFFELGRFPEIPLMEDFAFARSCRRWGRIRRLPLAVRTTARRFERHPIKAPMVLATFPTLFRLGVRPETLARWYGEVR